MNYIRFFVWLCLLGAISLAQTNVSGNISGNWTIANSPYIVTSNLVLQPGDTLVIDPGVEVRFDGNYRFDIFGTFLAIGTESDSIKFTKNGSTNWMSLNFADDTNDNSKLQYCIFEYGTDSGYDPYWGVVNFNLTNPTISNSRIANCNGGGIYLHYSESNVLNNIITNITHDGIILNESKGNIVGNILNNINSTGIFIQGNSDSTIISNNMITGGNSSGITATNSTNLIISQNQIQDCNWNGISLSQYCNYSTIDSNIISNNFSDGISLNNNNDYVTISKNTISNNSNQGVRINGNAYLTIRENIISNNGVGVTLIYYNDIVNIIDNIITGNTDYGIYFYSQNNGIIKNNTISAHNLAGIFFNYENYADVVGNLIYNNGDYGVYLYVNGNCEVRNNTIDGHTQYGLYWGSVNYSQYTLNAVNNSITNNVIGITCNNGGDYNNIAYNNCWNNSSANFSGDLPTGTGNLTDINSNGTVSDIYYNISEYPQYTDQVNGDFTLQEGSPNIDAGDPNYQDPDGSISDIGSHYFYQAIPSINLLPLSVNLNRVTIGSDTTITLKMYNPGDSTLIWSVSSDSGWVIINPGSGSLTSGDTVNLTIDLNSSSLASGTHTPNLFFTSNDPDTPILQFPISIRIVNMWRVALTAFAGGMTDEGNSFGFDEDATDGLDGDWDYPEPPPAPVNYFQVGFTHSEWSNEVQFYSTDIRNHRDLYGTDTEVWACSLATDLTSSTASLTFSPSTNFPEGYTIWIINGSDTVDVTTIGNYSIGIVDGEAVFSVMVKGIIPDPPVIAISQPTSGDIFTENQTLTVNWNIQNIVLYYDLYYTIDGTNWNYITSLDENAQSYSWAIPSGVYSVNTWFKVFAHGAGGTSGYDEVGPLAIIPQSLSKSFSEGWNLYSLPIISTSGSTIGTVFNSTFPSPHYLYRLVGDNGYELLDDSYTVTMAEGYWLALFEDYNTTMTGTSLLDTSAIVLNQGWNLIGCPQPFDVDTSSIKIINNTDTLGFTNAVETGVLASSAIYTWNDTTNSYSNNSFLSHWKGHWISVLNSGATLLVYPKFRIAPPALLAKESSEVTESEWSIHFSAEIAGISDHQTVLGVSQNASIGFDPLFDIPAPPTPPGGNYIQAYFSHSNWNPILGEQYNADIQDPLAEGETRTWNITLDGNTTNQILFSWSNLISSLPSSYTANLTIVNTNELINMWENTSVLLSSNFPQEITIEIHSPLLSIENSVLPLKYALHQPYPNPFNQTTSIKYDLPEDSFVRISVYDLLGRHIINLVNANMTAGYRSVRWNGTDTYGEPVSSGMYIFQIQAGSFVQTKKMVLLK